MIRRQVVVPVSPDRLWSALTDPEQMSGWFGGRVEWDLREGAPARFVDDDGTRREGLVEAVRPGRHLRFSWWPAPAGDPHAGAGESQVSEVSYLLEPAAGGTRLTIQERRVEGPAGVAGTAAGGDTDASGGADSGRGASGPAGWPGPTARARGAGATTVRAASSAGATGWSAWDDRLAAAWVRLAAPARAVARS